MRAGRFWPAWLALLSLVVALAVVVPSLAPAGSSAAATATPFARPGAAHPLGTDQLGADVLVRTFAAARNSLALALLSTAIAMLLATLVGGASGAVGGVLDAILMRVVDVLLAFPGLLMALAIVALLRSGPVQAAVAVGLSLAPAYSRVVRAAVLAVRSRTFVEAARTLGGGSLWIISHHILPSIRGELIAYGTVVFAWATLNMAALDFLGVSGSPSMPTWGRMLADGRTYLRAAPWIALPPGILLTLSVLSVLGLTDAWRRSLPGGFPRG